MKLMMIRHPVTLANIEGVVQGSVEGEIASRAYKQINQLNERLKSEHFDKCYSSDAHRCKVLAETISDYHNITPEYSPLFREMANGVWDGKKKGDVKRLSMVDPYNFKPEGGESLNDLAIRAKEGLNLILSEGGERNILISHGWFLKIFLGMQLGMETIDSIRKLKFSNCAISEINIDGETCLIEYLNNRDYLVK